MEQNPPQRQAMISGKDRISELADSIICEILSKLPTKDAVATTILSKRWKGQWTYCFNLDFSDRGSLRFNPCILRDEDTETCFVNVKDVITSNKSPCIKKFRLQSDTMDESDVAACLDSVVGRNVEEVELDVSWYQSDGVLLPQNLFTCQTLVFLDISNSWADIDMPPLVHLPSLKVFHANLYNPSDAVTTKLFCGMPVLEDLSITLSFLQSVEMVTLNIFISSLKRLKLKLEEVYNYQIVVRVPSLKELDIFDDIVSNYVFEEFPLDVEAKLKFTMCATQLPDDEAARAIQLMNAISGVKSLALSSCIPQTQNFGDVAVFPNLTCLEVGVTPCCGLTFLPSLIDRSPNLVFLVLKMEYGLTFLENLLEVAEVLDEVVICTYNMMLEERKNLHLKLSSLPRGSKDCQFKVLE